MATVMDEYLVEMRHGNEGIVILEPYVADDDMAFQERPRYIVDYATSGTTAPGPVAATN